MARYHATCLLAAMLFTSTASPAPGSNPAARPDAEALRNLIARQGDGWLAVHDVPSVAIAFVQDGRLTWTFVTGEQSPGVPATRHTLYNLASLTKPVSAEVVLRLASAGKISLDAPMAAHWVDPDVAGHEWTPLLTARIALSHQTGFANWRRDSGQTLSFLWKPGSQTGYSGEGYDYVGRYIERALGQPFEALAKTTVLDPAGMHESAFTARAWFAGRMAEPRGPRGESPPQTQHTWSAADLMRATIGDYGRFLASVMRNDGLSADLAAHRLDPTRDLATPEALAGLCEKAQVTAAHCNGSVGPALGWEVLVLDGETFVNHSGASWGVRTFAFHLPARGYGAVILTNGENGMQVIREIVAAMVDDPLFIATL